MDVAGPIIAIVRLVTRSGARPDLVRLLRRELEAVASETGTTVFTIMEDRGDGDTVWLVEAYDDESALQTHQSSETYASLAEPVGKLVRSRDVWFASVVAGKRAEWLTG